MIASGRRYKINSEIASRSMGTPRSGYRILNVSFAGRIGTDILEQLNGVAASTGSACHSGRVELSPVLAAMGVPERIGMGALRFSLGRGTTADDRSGD